MVSFDSILSILSGRKGIDCLPSISARDKEYIDKPPTLPANDSPTFFIIWNICEPVR